MKYLPRPEFANKLSRATPEDIAGITAFIKLVEHSDRDELLKSGVQALADDIFTFRIAQNTRLIFTFAKHEGEEYLVFLDWIALLEDDKDQKAWGFTRDVLINPIRN